MKKKSNIDKRPYTIDEWINIKYKDEYDKLMKENRDFNYDKLYREMPLYAMKEITDYMVNSSKMFSKEGWEKIDKLTKESGVNEFSGPSNLADLNIDFITTWLDDNNLGITPHEPSYTRKDNIEVYYDECSDYYWYFKGNLQDKLLDRYVDYLQHD